MSDYQAQTVTECLSTWCTLTAGHGGGHTDLREPRTAREELAHTIRDGVGVWRTPLEAADAILDAVTTTEWQFLNPELGGWAGTLEAGAKYLQKDHGYLIRSRQVTAWEVTE